MTNPLERKRWDPAPFAQAYALALALPLAIVIWPLAAGDLDRLLRQGWIYFLMPVFAGLGFVTYLWVRWTLRPRKDPRGPRGVLLGLLVGGWLAGSLLLWIASEDRPGANRVLLSLSGGLMLVGFWEWMGGLLGYAGRKPGVADSVEPERGP